MCIIMYVASSVKSLFYNLPLAGKARCIRSCLQCRPFLFDVNYKSLFEQGASTIPEITDYFHANRSSMNCALIQGMANEAQERPRCKAGTRLSAFRREARGQAETRHRCLLDVTLRTLQNFHDRLTGLCSQYVYWSENASIVSNLGHGSSEPLGAAGSQEAKANGW